MSATQPIDDLAAILQAIDAAASDPTNLSGLLSSLTDSRSGCFTGAILLKGGYAGRAFVIESVRNCSSWTARQWMRWPLRRLFTRMKPGRILHPHDGNVALAIPFAFKTTHYVVVAPLSSHAEGPAWEPLFSALESITVPQRVPSSLALSDKVAPEAEPRIVGLRLCAQLYGRIEPVLRQRGWSIECIERDEILRRRFDEGVPDIVAIDMAEQSDPLASLTALHRTIDSAVVRVLAFCAPESPERLTRTVIDRRLSHDADREAIFKAFKQLALESSLARQAHADELDFPVERRAAAQLTFQELANFAAAHAAKLLSGWGCCVLVSERGTVTRAEHPFTGHRTLSAIPKSFLSDTPTFDVHSGDAFLTEVTDDRRDQTALLSLEPRSGATLPLISSDGKRRGVLVACSRDRWADSAAFDALDRFAQIVAARCYELESDSRMIPEYVHDRLWKRFRDRALELAVYRSNDCAIPWRYRPLESGSGVLMLGLQDDGPLMRRLNRVDSVSDRAVADMISECRVAEPCFVAAIDFTAQSVSYAGRGFSPPIPLAASGPSGVIGTSSALTAGVAPLTSLQRALICDDGLLRWLYARQPSVGNLAMVLQDEAPQGLASIVTMGYPAR